MNLVLLGKTGRNKGRLAQVTASSASVNVQVALTRSVSSIQISLWVQHKAKQTYRGGRCCPSLGE